MNFSAVKFISRMNFFGPHSQANFIPLLRNWTAVKFYTGFEFFWAPPPPNFIPGYENEIWRLQFSTIRVGSYQSPRDLYQIPIVEKQHLTIGIFINSTCALIGFKLFHCTWFWKFCLNKSFRHSEFVLGDQFLPVWNLTGPRPPSNFIPLSLGMKFDGRQISCLGMKMKFSGYTRAQVSETGQAENIHAVRGAST